MLLFNTHVIGSGGKTLLNNLRIITFQADASPRKLNPNPTLVIIVSRNALPGLLWLD